MSEEIKSVITHAIVNDDNNTSYDFDIAVEHDSGEKYSAKDILAKVVRYIETTPFLYIGNEEPLNKHVGIWLDTTSGPEPRKMPKILTQESN